MVLFEARPPSDNAVFRRQVPTLPVKTSLRRCALRQILELELAEIRDIPPRPLNSGNGRRNLRAQMA